MIEFRTEQGLSSAEAGRRCGESLARQFREQCKPGDAATASNFCRLAMQGAEETHERHLASGGSEEEYDVWFDAVDEALDLAVNQFARTPPERLNRQRRRQFDAWMRQGRDEDAWELVADVMPASDRAV